MKAVEEGTRRVSVTAGEVLENIIGMAIKEARSRTSRRMERLERSKLKKFHSKKGK